MAERDDLLLGADMGGTRFRAALVDGRSEIVWRAEQPAGDVGDSEALVAAMTGLLGQGLARAGTSLRAAGVAVAGPLDPVRGVMFRPPNLPGLAGLPLASLLGKALDRPVFLENDANAAAWGEFACGAARDASSMVLLTLGTGVGGGIVLDGRLLRGARGCAAELGHMVVNPAGPLCNCGARGCLEMYASSTAVLAAWRAAVVSGRATEPEDGGVEDTEGLFRLAERGDAAARAVFAEAGGFLGEALGSLANALDMETAVVSGGMAGAWAYLETAALERFRGRALAPARDGLRIVRGRLGGDAGLVGAALLAVERLEEGSGA